MVPYFLWIVEPEYDFVRPLKDMDTREKEACEFECEVNDPDARVTWYREDKVLHNQIFQVKDARWEFWMPDLRGFCLVF